MPAGPRPPGAAGARFALPWVRGCAGVLVTLVLAGCERESIRVYQAPKETAPQRQAMSTPFESRVPQIHWKLPAGWQELPAGQMRVGQFAVSGQGEQKA